MFISYQKICLLHKYRIQSSLSFSIILLGYRDMGSIMANILYPIMNYPNTLIV